jgi:N-acetylneuraminic acid mutarotase
MFRLGRKTRRAALLAFAVALAAAAALVIGSASLLGSSAKPATASWRRLPPAPLAFEAGQTSVWTGKQLIVAGLTGAGADGNLLDATEAALAYDPAKRSWQRLAAPPKTEAYCRRTAVWTGSEMLVWGCRLTAYDPDADQWRLLPPPPSGAGIVVWTGKEMLGWGGGCCGDAISRGEAFDPKTERWHPLAESPLAPEQQPLGAWTGRELVLFVSGISAADGKPYADELARAAAYDPATDTWRRIAPLPERRAGAMAVWDGKEILVVGGRDGNGSPAGVGLAYNPATNGWRRLPAMETGRMQAVGAWTGSRLLVWGGELGRQALVLARTGFAFDPGTDSWARLPQAPIQGRIDPVAAWTGRELIVWGGLAPANAGSPEHLADGAAFTPGASKVDS